MQPHNNTKHEEAYEQLALASELNTQKKSPTAFRTISEVADDLNVQQHVLRFWETKFSQIRPLKRGGGRRYYRPEDVALLQTIHHLLYTEGYTIKGVQKLLKDQGKNQVVQNNRPSAGLTAAEAEGRELISAAQESGADAIGTNQRALLRSVLEDLKDIRRSLRG